MKKMNKQETFKKLITACENPDTYSLSEICIKIDISYEEIKTWAQENKKWANSLEICKEMCATNAEIAGLKGKIEAEKALKHMGEHY